MPDKFKKYILTLIVFGGFALSIFWSFHYRIKPVVDAKAYDIIAMNLASGNGYRENLGMPLENDYAIVRVGPFYEFFLAGIYKIFGHHYEIVWILQAILHVVSACLLYYICRHLISGAVGEKAGLIAAGIFSFYPDLIEISAMLMSETLYLFLFILMVYVFFVFFEKPGLKNSLWLGITSGLAIITRPPILFLLPVIIFYFFKKMHWKRALVASVIFLATISAIFFPWTARNYKIYDRFMPLGVAGSYNFWIGNYPGGSGEQGPTPEMHIFEKTHTALQINDESIRQFKSFLLSHPLEFLRITALRVNKYWSVIRPMGFWFYQTGIPQMLFVFSSAVASIVLFIFGLAGTLKSITDKNEKLYYLFAFAIITPLILFATVVETRYRFQIYPILAIFVGFFLAGKEWWKKRVLYLAAGIVILNGIIDLALSFDVFKEKLLGF